MSRVFRLLLLVVTAGLAFAVQAGGTVPKPAIKIEAEGKCIAAPEEMRRNHMEMLKHQRDKTLRQGVRGAPVSLNGCIDCHARHSGTVTGHAEAFCESCHRYAAVKLDCWDCHHPGTGQSLSAAGAKP